MVQFIKTSKAFLHEIQRQGTDPLGVKKVLVKMINQHVRQFEKCNTNKEFHGGRKWNGGIQLE